MRFNKKKVKSYGVSAANFYGKAKAAAKFGRTIYNKYKAGKKVALRARRTYRKLTRTKRSSHYSGNNAGHNDWAQLPPKTFYVSKRKPWKTLGKFHLEHSTDVVLDQGSTGYQITGNGVSTFTSAQMYGNTSIFIANYKENWATNPFELNPYVTPVYNNIYTQALGAIAENDKYFIKDTVQTLSFVSLQPTACRVEVYWLLCNVNTDRDPQQAWIDAVNSLRYAQPALAEGAHTTAAITPNATGAGSVSNPRTVPPKGFYHYWKKLHYDVFMLQPGDNMSMVRTFVYNLMVQRNEIGDSSNQFLKGISLCPLVVVNSAVVGIGADGQAFPPVDIDRVTYGRSKVGFLHSCKMNFAALPVNRYEITRKEIGYVDGNSNNATAIIDADDEEISANPIG